MADLSIPGVCQSLLPWPKFLRKAGAVTAVMSAVGLVWSARIAASPFLSTTKLRVYRHSKTTRIFFLQRGAMIADLRGRYGLATVNNPIQCLLGMSPHNAEC